MKDAFGVERLSKGLPSYLRATPKALLSPALRSRVRLAETGKVASRNISRAKANPRTPRPFEKPKQLPLFDRSPSGKVTPSYQAKKRKKP